MPKNQTTPVVAHQEMQKILEDLRNFTKGLDSTIAAFSQFGIGTEELGPGEAEITLFVPRRAVLPCFSYLQKNRGRRGG